MIPSSEQQQYQQQQQPPQWMMPPAQAGQAPPSAWAPQGGAPPQAQPYGAGAGAAAAAGSNEIRSLWIGDLQQWMDENYILSCFVHTGEVKEILKLRKLGFFFPYELRTDFVRILI